MINFGNQKEKICATSVNQFPDQLVDHAILLWGVVGCLGFLLTQMRAYEIGWSVRDLIQTLAFFCMLSVIFCRRKISARFKTVFLITISLIVGIVGSLTLGMLAGGIFFLPLAAIFMALFYSERSVIIFMLLSLLFICLVAIGFTNGHIKLPLSADLLITNPKHWSAYIFCYGFFSLIACKVIIRYRLITEQLSLDLRSQCDELSRMNRDLNNASEEIKTLRGIIPICSFCRNVRNNKGYYEEIEAYIHKHSDVDFSHTICPSCLEMHYPEVYEGVYSKKTS